MTAAVQGRWLPKAEARGWLRTHLQLQHPICLPRSSPSLSHTCLRTLPPAQHGPYVATVLCSTLPCVNVTSSSPEVPQQSPWVACKCPQWQFIHRLAWLSTALASHYQRGRLRACRASAGYGHGSRELATARLGAFDAREDMAKRSTGKSHRVAIELILPIISQLYGRSLV
jgi:hypothetical protein